MGEILDAAEWLYNHVFMSDVVLALLSLFVFSSILSKIRHKGPMLWPVLGIVPMMLVHVHKVHEWLTDSFNGTTGTFAYQGMWLGKAYGIIKQLIHQKLNTFSRQISKTSLRGSTTKSGFKSFLETVFSTRTTSHGSCKRDWLHPRCTPAGLWTTP
ncbi:hypothetical protein QQ045_003958 [Rhodiola kirilowii]